MTPENAVAIIEGMTYKRGWGIDACRSSNYNAAVILSVSWSSPNSDVAYAPFYDMGDMNLGADFVLVVGDCDDEIQLADKVMHCILKVEMHEAREFFAIGGESYDKIYHPHTTVGMQNWHKRSPIRYSDDLSDRIPLVFA